ncbi:MAG: polyprenyl synthetase family protein, partial [Anaerolineae bacterium]|nr:polyprenyl synthetase family protein [Anaerolineae bacterium]
MALKEMITRLLPLIDRALREALAYPDPALRAHYGMMAYHLGFVDAEFRPARADAGKRIRPLLCLLVTEAVGGSVEQAMPAAVALELLHNFSLIHDDVEDGSPMRRHRPSVWKLWGVPQAVNVGDGMFSLAHLALERLSERGVAPEVVLEALRVFDEVCRLLTEGQYLDLAFEARTWV